MKCEQLKVDKKIRLMPEMAQGREKLEYNSKDAPNQIYFANITDSTKNERCKRMTNAEEKISSPIRKKLSLNHFK